MFWKSVTKWILVIASVLVGLAAIGNLVLSPIGVYNHVSANWIWPWSENQVAVLVVFAYLIINISSDLAKVASWLAKQAEK